MFLTNQMDVTKYYVRFENIHNIKGIDERSVDWSCDASDRNRLLMFKIPLAEIEVWKNHTLRLDHNKYLSIQVHGKRRRQRPGEVYRWPLS